MDTVFTPSDFVAVFNQTVEYAYPHVSIEGELSNFKISKGKWVYFDLKDASASVKFFGTIYALPGPLENGLMVRVAGQPRLNPLYGFSLTVQSITPVGEGSINKAAKLLQAKLTKEGLFDDSRKRSIPYPPQKIGLVASKESAGYADFIKVINARWGNIEILHVDTQVQGESAVDQIVKAVNYLNQLSETPDVIVVTRGGGSADDLAVFNTEQITRAVAASRVPTLVAIGHEIDTSLAELAADKRASTPSNAAELLVPDKIEQQRSLNISKRQLDEILQGVMQNSRANLTEKTKQLNAAINQTIITGLERLTHKKELLTILDPRESLRRGYAVVRKGGKAITNAEQLKNKDKLTVTLYKGSANVSVDEVH